MYTEERFELSLEINLYPMNVTELFISVETPILR